MDCKENTFKLSNITLWRVFAYFIIYSVIGYIIETAFGFFTKGLLESRQGFLYGPFCPIYGLGAIIMIIGLQPFKKNIYTLFVGGFILGSILEYIISLVGELVFKVNWWDYSDRFLNINGRICFTFSLFWGVLAIYLIKYFNNTIDKLINKIKEKVSIKVIKITVVFLMIFLLIDGSLTAVAVKLFFTRTIYEYNIDVNNKEKYITEYENLKQHNFILKLEDRIFSNEKMIKTFPNLKMKAKNGEIIYINSIYKEIKPYYLKFFNPPNLNGDI